MIIWKKFVEEEQHNMKEQSKRTAINITAQCVAFIVNIGVSFLLTPYITETLGKEVYGFVGLAYNVTSYISVFTVAFNTMLNIFVASCYHKGDIKKANEFFSSVLIADIVISVVLFVPLLLITYNLENVMHVPASSMNDIKMLWLLIFINFLINLAFGPYGTGLFVKNRLDITALRGIESNVLKAAILIVMFFVFSPKVWFVGFSALVCGVYVVFLNYRYHRKLTPEIRLEASSFNWNAIKELLMVGIWNTINQLTSIFMSGLDLIVSNLFFKSLGMGYISYAQTVPTQMTALITTIKSTFAPNLTKVYAETEEGDITPFINEVKSAMQICGFLGSVPILVFMVFGTSFYKLWLPTLTADEVITINILAIMILIPTMFDVYISPLYNVNSITKKIKIPVIVTFIIGIANIICEIGLIQITNLGIYAIEIVTAILIVGKVLFFTPIYAARILKLKWTTFYSPLFKGAIANIISLVLLYLIKCNVNINSWLQLFIICGCAAVVGYAVDFAIVLTKENKRKVIALIKKKVLRK